MVPAIITLSPTEDIDSDLNIAHVLRGNLEPKIKLNAASGRELFLEVDSFGARTHIVRMDRRVLTHGTALDRPKNVFSEKHVEEVKGPLARRSQTSSYRQRRVPVEAKCQVNLSPFPASERCSSRKAGIT